MALRNKIFAGAAATALTVANMLPFNSAAADEANTFAARPTVTAPQTELAILEQKPVEAWQQAGDYAKNHRIVTFALYGRTNQWTSEEVAKIVQEIFAKQGVESRYFISPEHEDKLGVRMSFYIDDVGFGPVSLGEAPPLITYVAKTFKEAYPDNLLADIGPTPPSN